MSPLARSDAKASGVMTLGEVVWANQSHAMGTAKRRSYMCFASRCVAPDSSAAVQDRVSPSTSLSPRARSPSTHCPSSSTQTPGTVTPRGRRTAEEINSRPASYATLGFHAMGAARHPSPMRSASKVVSPGSYSATSLNSLRNSAHQLPSVRGWSPRSASAEGSAHGSNSVPATPRAVTPERMLNRRRHKRPQSLPPSSCVTMGEVIFAHQYRDLAEKNHPDWNFASKAIVPDNLLTVEEKASRSRSLSCRSLLRSSSKNLGHPFPAFQAVVHHTRKKTEMVKNSSPDRCSGVRDSFCSASPALTPRNLCRTLWASPDADRSNDRLSSVRLAEVSPKGQMCATCILTSQELEQDARTTAVLSSESIEAFKNGVGRTAALGKPCSSVCGASSDDTISGCTTRESLTQGCRSLKGRHSVSSHDNHQNSWATSEDGRGHDYYTASGDERFRRTTPRTQTEELEDAVKVRDKMIAKLTADLLSRDQQIAQLNRMPRRSREAFSDAHVSHVLGQGASPKMVTPSSRHIDGIDRQTIKDATLWQSDLVRCYLSPTDVVAARARLLAPSLTRGGVAGTWPGGELQLPASYRTQSARLKRKPRI